MDNLSGCANNDPVNNDEILVMNFSDDEDFPIPLPLKTENLFDTSLNPDQANETDHVNSLKFESYAMCIEDSSKEDIIRQFELDASIPDEEFILGPDATADILAIARNTEDNNDDLTEGQAQPDSDVVELDSDSNDNHISNQSCPMVSISQHILLNNPNSDQINDLQEENFSDNVSSIIITNVESIAEDSENISSRQSEERATAEENISSNVIEESTAAEENISSNVIEESAVAEENFSSNVIEDSTVAEESISSNVIEESAVAEENISSNVIEESAAAEANISSNVIEECAAAEENISSNVIEESAVTEENVYSNVIEDSATDENLANSEASVNLKTTELLKVNNRNGPIQMFKCVICDFSAKTRFFLSRHMISHVGEIGSQANQDSITKSNTSSQSTCSQPVDLMPPKNNMFKCKFCTFSSKIRFALQRHVLTHADITKQTESSTGQNNIKSSNVNASQCKYCPYVAKNRVALLCHERFAHSEKLKHKCKYCTFVPKSKVGLTNHIKFTHPTKFKVTANIFKCKFCSFSSKFRFALQRHTLTHQDITKKPKTHLNDREPSNVDSTHTEVTKKAKCSAEQNSIQFNVNISHSQPCLKVPKTSIFKCKFCSFASKVRCALQRHTLIHKNTTVNGAKCKYCSFAAKNNAGLTSHLRSIHRVHKVNGIKVSKTNTFKCNFCPFQSKLRFILQRHLLTHTNTTKKPGRPRNPNQIKSFSDDVTFTDNTKKSECSLDARNTGSSNLNVFKCEYCSFVPKNKVGLVNHTRILHPEKISVECLSCHKSINKFKIQKHKLICNKINKKRITADRGGLTSVEPLKAKIKTNIVTSTHILVSESSSPKYKCGFCSYTSNHDMSIRQHVTLHTIYKRPIYHCKECNYKSTKVSLALHVKSAHGVKGIPLKKNGNSLAVQPQVTKSVNKSVIPKNKALQTEEPTPNIKLVKDKLNRAAGTGGPARLQCSYCSHISKSYRNFQVHLHMHTNSNRKIYRCKQCNYESTKRALTIHIKTAHRGRKTHIVKGKKRQNNASQEVKQEKKLVDSSNSPSIESLSDHESNIKQNRSASIKKNKSLLADKLSNKLELNLNEDNKKSSIENRTTVNDLGLSTFLFVCEICGYVTSQKETLIVHKVAHATSALITDDDKTKSLDSKCSVENTGQFTNSATAQFQLGVQNNKITPFQDKWGRKHILLPDYTMQCAVCKRVLSHAGAFTNHKCKTIAKGLKHEQHPFPLNMQNAQPETKIFKGNDATSLKDKRGRQYKVLKGNKIQCTECKRILFGRAAYAKHKCENLVEFFKRVKQEGDNFTCKTCHFSSTSWCRVNTHLLVHKTLDEAAIHKCSVCNYRTKYKGNLVLHLKRHEPGPEKKFKYRCDNCNFKTNHQQYMKKHKVSCRNGPITCDVCGFKTANLANHKKVVHNLHEKKSEKVDETTDENKYKCDNCDFKTNYKQNLQNHKILHININQFRVYKNKTYNVNIKSESRKASNHHTSKHHNSSENVSSTLKQDNEGKSTILKESTKSSIQFSCKYCEFRTKFRFNLKKHCERAHSGPLGTNKSQELSKKMALPLFKCTYESCSFLSKQKCSLNRHLVYVHKTVPSKLNTFKCNFCTFKTNYKYGLERHSLSVHARSSLQCSSCFYTSPDMSTLQDHFNMCHVKKH